MASGSYDFTFREAEIRGVRLDRGPWKRKGAVPGKSHGDRSRQGSAPITAPPRLKHLHHAASRSLSDTAR
jgi:hypothetical protein